MTLAVEVQLAVAGDEVPGAAEFERWVRAALSGRRHAEVTIRVVDEAESQALNRRYRDRDSATNVLSFPADRPPGLPVEEAVEPLGDVVICAPVVGAEARNQGKHVAAHWAHLVVHGTLHLLGYDHQSGPQAGVMERREVEILERLGYSNPYE